MLRLSRLADYGVLLMTRVPFDPTASAITARELSEQTGLPWPTVGKILKDLSRAGLLASRRGQGGGYRLARPATEISLAEVVGAIDGPVDLTCCAEANESCALTIDCPVRDRLAVVSRVVHDALAQVTLAEMRAPASSRATRRRARRSAASPR
jgi:FeS assembly SUF system regulator